MCNATHCVKLVENGASIPLTDKNKSEYIHLFAIVYFFSKIEPQISAILYGFYKVIPKCMVRIFDKYDHQLYFCDIQEVHVDYW